MLAYNKQQLKQVRLFKNSLIFAKWIAMLKSLK